MKAGRVIRACRHSRADGTRRRGGRGADQGSRLSTPMSAAISPRLLHEIEGGAGLAVIADEAIKTADLRGLTALAERSAVMVGFSVRAADASGRRSRAQSGRGAARAGAGQRHLHRAAVSSDHAGQHRRLRGQGPPPPVPDPRHSRRSHRKRRPAADRAERRPSRRAGTASAGARARSFRHLQAVFRPQAGRAVLLPRICWRRFIPTIARGASEVLDADHQDRQGLQHRIPQHLARRLAALGRRPRPRGARARRQHQVAGRRFAPTSPRARLRKSSARTCWRNWRPSAPRWRN